MDENQVDINRNAEVKKESSKFSLVAFILSLVIIALCFINSLLCVLSIVFPILIAFTTLTGILIASVCAIIAIVCIVFTILGFAKKEPKKGFRIAALIILICSIAIFVLTVIIGLIDIGISALIILLLPSLAEIPVE